MEIVRNRIEQLGFWCPEPPPTDSMSEPIYALLCIPMYQVAVLRTLLIGRRRIDSIIYDFALEAIQLFFEAAEDRIVELSKLMIAQSIVSVAHASGSGWFGTGAQPSPEQSEIIEVICDKLSLQASEQASTALAEL